jgi:hypothetical protein
MNEIPLFKKGHFYLSKSTGLLVLCLEDHFGRKTNGDQGWKAQVIMFTPKSATDWKIGQIHDNFNLTPDYWENLGLDSNSKENIVNEENITND